MTPQERQLINELFQRVGSLENAPRDPDAEAMIREGLRRAPNAMYSLVQTVLVQDEALKAANAHIQEYEQANGGATQHPNEPPRGFLDSMRDSIFGRDEQPRGSVPRVSPGGAPMGGGGAPMGAPQGYRQDPYRQDPWGRDGNQQMPPPGYQQGAPMQAPPQGGGGGSFLGTAAAAAAGLIGGSLLMGGIRSALGGHQGGGAASGAFDSLTGRGGGSPWSGSAANSDLARDAGLNDIAGSRGGGGSSQRSSLFDQAKQDQKDDDDADADDADFGDDGDDSSDSGDSQEV